MNRIDVRSRRAGAAYGAPALCGAVALVVCASATAEAQVAEADTVPQYNLDALVVSVLRTPVVLGDAAYAISVIDERDLRQGKTGMFLEEALQALPGVQVQNRFNYAVGERISIRGFGSRAQFGVRGIRVLVDGIPATLPDGQSTLDHVDIGSLGRVEARRGPASAMYGNASGGVLRFETEMPSDAPAREELTVVGGSDGLLRLQSATSGTVGSAGYLISLNRLSYDGFRNVPAGGSYGAADRFHVNARLEQEIGGGELGITVNHLDLDAENPGSLSQSLFDADPHQVHSFYTRFQTRKEVQQSQLGVTWAGPISGLTAEVAFYGLSRDFFNPLPFDMVDVDRRAGGGRVSVGRSSVSGSVTVDLRVGAELDLQNDDRREYGNDDGVLGALGQNQTERVRSTGLFVQASVAPDERVSMLGGLRYDRTHFEVDDLFPVTSGVNEDDSGERNMSSFSPTVGVHFQATPELGIFANYATSFETPTTVELGNRESGAGGFNPDLDPQRGRTFEVGARGALNERFAYEATAFRTDLEDELVSFQVPAAPGIDYFRNAGSSHRNGLELTAWARLHDLASAQASYSYTDARYDEYEVGGVDVGADCPGDPLSGSCQVPGLAPQQLQGSVRFGPAEWYVEVGLEYTDEVPVNDENDGRFADAYTLFGVRVGASVLRLGRFELSPFAGLQNLTDETYVSSVTINAPGGANPRYYEPGPGRTFYLGGSVAVSR
jgi:iron complex outermembrane receptor protein